MEFDSILYIALTVIVGIAYWMTGRVVMARRPEGAGRPAGTAFGVWWLGLAGLQVTSVISFALDLMGVWTLPTFLAYTHLLILLIVAILGALVYYFLYLFTGRSWLWKPVAGAYLAYWVLLLYYIAAGEPEAIRSTPTGAELVYANDLTRTAFGAAISLLLLLPPIIGAIGYVSLVTKVQERSQKFRIITIATAFILWFSTSLVVGRIEFGDTAAWRLISQVIALSAAMAVYVAFEPPQWVRKRLGLRGYGEATDGS